MGVGDRDNKINPFLKVVKETGVMIKEVEGPFIPSLDLPHHFTIWKSLTSNIKIDNMPVNSVLMDNNYYQFEAQS